MLKALTNTVQFFLITTSLAMPQTLFADGDSSAAVRGGFFKQLEKAQGLILRVQINERGEENSDSAVMKLYNGEDSTLATSELPTAWLSGTDVSSQPEISADDIARDSSTWGFHHYRHFGWVSPYYYYSYVPTYYYYGTYWYPAAQPVYYSYGYPYAYRYYYWGW